MIKCEIFSCVMESSLRSHWHDRQPILPEVIFRRCSAFWPPVAYKLVFSLPGQTTVHIMRLKLFESAGSEALAQVIATQSKSRQLSQCLILSRGALCQAMLCTRCDHSNEIY